MPGADKLKQDIKEIVHEVVDPRFDNVDSQLKNILDRLPPAPPAPASSTKVAPKP
jgi:hypothetical protein